MLSSMNGQLAIKQPVFQKIEVEIAGGIARSIQRTELIEVELVLGYRFDEHTTLKPGDKVILDGTAGLQQWAKKVYNLAGTGPFVLCPQTQIFGYRKT